MGCYGDCMARTPVNELLRQGAAILPRTPGIPEPRREAAWLLAKAWGRSELEIRLDPAAPVPDDVALRYRSWLERRAAGEPAHHLAGVCPFWGRDFEVSPAVLVPRPETELIVEAVLGSQSTAPARVLDVGTGSGCLAVTLALERPSWSVVATDVSMDALGVAKRNADRLGADVVLVGTDLATGLSETFDIVTANLPYVPSGAMAGLPAEVRHDPQRALDGGPDGLDLVRRLMADLPRVLVKGGVVLLELGEDQAPEVERLARRHLLHEGGRIKDLAGTDRIVILERPSPAD